MKSLFEPYKLQVKDVEKISNALIKENVISDANEIVNDHIAFRTLGVPNLGIASFEKIFLHYGYKKMDYYFFKEKKLNAYWYAPPEPRFPRIFISELRVGDLPENAQQIIFNYTCNITNDPVDNLNLDDEVQVGDFFYKNLWQVPTLRDYNILAEHSEYAAWVIYNRYYLNHYTISVHELKNGYNTLEAFNTFLQKIGIKLNDSGGVLKKSKDGLLKQSSSVAKMVDATFANGETTKVPGSYVEFAERLALPEFKNIPAHELKGKQRRDGFESANADKIFESTYDSQVNN
ncbi:MULTISPECIES: DUF1338 domain-containing protein [Flavobacteriaceae]|uniref:DUF1338 domain-containing protein n=1 Tax=Flavobacteriaceae TaxID=49546 RepID=UPI001FE6A7DB|nr:MULTISPECIES: DUF1338 domain-containing protein [Allomuricauda]MDC6367766.1 DUF1338 domain-containing protein [Muricauda sp. AC10]